MQQVVAHARRRLAYPVLCRPLSLSDVASDIFDQYLTTTGQRLPDGVTPSQATPDGFFDALLRGKHYAAPVELVQRVTLTTKDLAGALPKAAAYLIQDYVGEKNLNGLLLLTAILMHNKVRLDSSTRNTCLQELTDFIQAGKTSMDKGQIGALLKIRDWLSKN